MKRGSDVHCSYLGSVEAFQYGRPWPIGKLVMDFLFSLIELFSLGVTVKALPANIAQIDRLMNALQLCR